MHSWNKKTICVVSETISFLKRLFLVFHSLKTTRLFAQLVRLFYFKKIICSISEFKNNKTICAVSETILFLETISSIS